MLRRRFVMPTYDYRCEKCGHTFEAFQQMSAALLSECPECKGPLQRLIGGGTGLIFKGSGFYITDYKKSNSSTSNASKKEKPADPAASATSEKKAEQPEKKEKTEKTDKPDKPDKSDKAAA
jgi:putative FmdB family regulatory protein